MAIKTEKIILNGMAGNMDCAIDWPDTPIRGWTLVLHPHPLHEGTRDNKIVTTVARTCAQNGLVAVRPNFRGVGLSEGEFDKAHGETRDMQMLIEQIERLYPEVGHKKWVLAGFSFGTAVAAQLYAEQKEAQHQLPDAMMLLGPAVWRFQYRDIELPADLLVVHGEKDEVVPLQEVFDWIRPYQIPVTVIPEATHFFHGFLIQLKRLIQIKLDQILK